MAEIRLQNEIKRILENEILPDISIPELRSIKVYKHDIPLTTEFEGDEEDTYFPCCIVKTCGGEIEKASDPQKTTVEIVIAIKDESENMSGHETLMIVIQRIRDYFLKHVGIRGEFRMRFPLKWNISDEFTTPYFIGNVVTVWELDAMRFDDPLGFL